jgi:predicted lipid-binding transport protein (Tim44 family)
MSSTDSSILFFFLFWCGIGGLVGALIGSGKGRAAAGFWLGLLLGIIGWIIVAFMSPRGRAGAYAAVQPAVSATAAAEYQRQLKQWAVSEAIRRDPSLGASSDSATLNRLEQSAQQIMKQAEVLRMQQQALRQPGNP